MIDPDVVLGSNVRIFDASLVNLFGCTIGDDTFIGPFVEITRGVVIGRRCTVESHAFICDGVSIGDDVFVGHGAMFTNDLYPRTDRHVVYPRTRVEDFASIGSNATIVGGVTIHGMPSSARARSSRGMRRRSPSSPAIRRGSSGASRRSRS